MQAAGLAAGEPAASRADAAALPPGDGAGAWTAAVHEHGGFALPYQLFVPAATAPGGLPLVIWLHGSGEAGSDNAKQLTTPATVGPRRHASPEIQARFPHLVLAPQTPGPIRWASTGIPAYDLDQTPITPSMAALIDLLPRLVAERRVDAGRIYACGLSRGGQGVWNLALQCPDWFAAIVPMCGSSSPRHAGRIAHLAVWAWHGVADTVTPVEVTRSMVGALRDAGMPAERLRSSEIAGGDHASAWRSAYADPELIPWLFSWRNPRPGLRRP